MKAYLDLFWGDGTYYYRCGKCGRLGTDKNDMDLCCIGGKE